MTMQTLGEIMDRLVKQCDEAQTWEYKPKTWETSPVVWANSQWAVTEYGIENVAGPYHYYIDKERIFLGDHWLMHMDGKNWVILPLFAEAYVRAVVHFKRF
jgi:hypothetical protein